MFLQNYPVNTVGGMEAVLQAADDLTTKREAEARAAQAASTGVSARIRGAVWGFSGQPGSAVATPALNATNEPARRQELSVGVNDSNTGPSTFTSRLADTVWRGITNQSVMDEPNTPTTPSFASPPQSPYPPSPQLLAQTFSPGPPSPLVLGSRGGTPDPVVIGTNLWNYAEKLRDSDTAAKLSKASTNLRVMALDAWHKRGASENVHDPPDRSTGRFLTDASHTRNYSAESESSYLSRRPPFLDTDPSYTPPPRPSHFRAPRDSVFLDISKSVSTPTSPTLSAASELSASSMGSGRSISGGPKPLLLSTSNIISPTNEGRKPWNHVAQDSISSTSSFSSADYMSKRRTSSINWDSDTTKSRVVPIRRGTGNVSPAAIGAKLNRSRPDSASSERSDYLGKLPELPKPTAETRAPIPEERSTNPPSPIQSPPETPSWASPISEGVRVQDAEPQRGSLVLNDISEDNAPIQTFLQRKTRSPTQPLLEEAPSDSSAGGARIRQSQRVKSRRQLPQLRTGTGDSGRTMTASPSTLRLPEWPHGVTAEEAPTPRASDFEIPFPPSPPRSPRSPRRPRKSTGDGEARPRKPSTEDREGTRPRKVSGGGRARKVSGGSVRRNRESSSIEGDDEGYDDLLSAYESEEGHHR